ncbi:MAG TPA: putative Ig domain-containing protein, partial [Steroidobacteraceae bacterium]
GIASQAATYRSDFYDITRGTDGSCATCFATIGYDLPSGVGTPNVSPLLTSLAGGLGSQAPVVTPTTIKGTVGTPLSFVVTTTAAAPVSYTLTNAPSGLTISSAGVIAWGTPVLGTYAVTVTARDTVSALTGQGLLTISIVSPQPPVVAPALITGTAGTGLAFTIAVTDSNPFTLALNGAQPGMAISAAGLFSWPNPTVGKYTVTVLAKDTKTGLSGSGVLTVNISPAQPPTVVRTSATGIAGQKLTFTVGVSAAGPVAFSLSNAPTGMSISNSGVVSWPSPVAGSYSVTIVATDTNTHLSGSAAAAITIAPAGPVIHASSITGVAGKALTGSISFTDSTSNLLKVTIGSIPAGMILIPSGAAIGLQWASPVAGSYSLTVTLKDGNGQSAATTMPIIIASK